MSATAAYRNKRRRKHGFKNAARLANWALFAGFHVASIGYLCYLAETGNLGQTLNPIHDVYRAIGLH